MTKATDKPAIRRRGRPPKKNPKAPKRALTTPLSAAHELFIERYMVRMNATRAYQDAYPEAKYRTCSSEGSRLLRDPRISVVIKDLVAKERARIRVTSQRVIDETAAMAFSSLADCMDEGGNMIAPKDLPRNVGVAVKRIKRREIMAPPDKEGVREVVGHTVEFEMHDKVGPLKLLGTHLGIFKEQIEVTPSDAWLAELKAARERSLKPKEVA